MLNWLKQKLTGGQSAWQQAQQLPGTKFPFPKGAKLRPKEEVILAVPSAIIGQSEEIGAVFLCDNNAEIMLNEKVGAWYVNLKTGMVFSLAKSCEVMLIGTDNRPRSFEILPPEKTPSDK